MTITKSSTPEGAALDPQGQQCKVAMVTGASRGIGLNLAKKLIANGYQVIANSRHITSSTLPENDFVQPVSGDIGKPNVAEQAVDAAIRNFGRIDLSVNNAGVFIPKPFTEYTVEDFRSVIETNLAGFFHVRQSAVQMRAQKSGHVVNITASIANQPAGSSMQPEQGRLGERHSRIGHRIRRRWDTLQCDRSRGRQHSNALSGGA